MTRRWSLAVLLLLVPGVVLAQDDCPGCYIGIYDDQSQSVNFGFWDPVSSPLKSIWVGILYEASVPQEMQGLTGIELSVDGIPPGPFGDPAFESVPQATVTIGSTIVTPDDSTGMGGVHMAWNTCLPGNRAMIRIDMLSLSAVGNDIVITVHRKFPPSSSSFPFPYFNQCNGPIFTRTRVNPSCYVLNPTVDPGGTVGGCKLTSTIAVEKGSWTAIKSLYQ